MATLSGLLGQVRQNESVAVANRLGISPYQVPPEANVGYPSSHASGAYQFQPGTWRQLTSQSGIGTQYSQAYLAPPAVQDQVASYAVSRYDPNSSFLWQASAPAGGYPQVTQDSTNNDTIAVPGGVGVADVAINENPTTGGGGEDVTRTLDGTPAAGTGDGTVTLDGSPATGGGVTASGLAGASSGGGSGLAYGGKPAVPAATVPLAITNAGTAITGGISSIGNTLGSYVSSTVAAAEAFLLRGGVMLLAVIMLLAAAWLMVPRDTKTTIAKKAFG